MAEGGGPGGELKARRSEWSQATDSKVDDVKQRQKEVRQKLKDLEEKEQERIAAQLVARQREEARRAAEEVRLKREAAQRAEEERKRLAGEELKKHQELLAKSKDAEKDALKAATAAFTMKAQLDAEAREKAYIMKFLSDVLQQVGLTASKCQHECRMKFSVVKVCEMRLAKRLERPPEEAFTDEVDEALETEMAVLNKARGELQQLAEEAFQIQREIRDVQSLVITGVSRENVRTRLSKSASLPNVVAHLSPIDTKDLLRKGKELIARGQDVDARGITALEQTTENCEKATLRVRSCFHKRSGETEELKKKLEHHKKQVTATISQAERRFQMLAMRSHRITGADEQTEQEMQEVKDMIQELRNGKRTLEEDYRKKTSSFKVDKSCMGLTKIRAGSHVDRKRQLPALSPSHAALSVGY